MIEERETALEARDVVLKSGSEEMREAISFSIQKKGIHGILGPDGSGKRELLRILAGIDESLSGEVEIGGALLSVENIALRATVALVPEKPTLVGSMTVRETLEFAGTAKRVNPELLPRQIREAEELLGLDGISRRLVRRLTDAERWRVALAMALLGNPEILLLDEPMRTLGEDSYEGRMELVSMLGKVKTVVISTVSYSLARALCEDVILLSGGRCLVQGGFEELESRLAQNGSSDSLEEIYHSLCVSARELREEVAE